LGTDNLLRLVGAVKMCFVSAYVGVSDFYTLTKTFYYTDTNISDTLRKIERINSFSSFVEHNTGKYFELNVAYIFFIMISKVDVKN